MRVRKLMLKNGLITIIRPGQRVTLTVRVYLMQDFRMLIITEKNISAGSVICQRLRMIPSV